ncbi:MAG: lipid-A-disaccharide synthase, partial [Desulfobulbaceae bacterium]
GSRKKEISTLLPLFLDAAENIQKESSEKLIFLLPLASTLEEKDLWQNGLKKGGTGLDIRIIRDDRYDVMAACEVVIAASGTVTLELALLDVPMVVSYKFSPLTYQLGRMLVKLKYFSLVNLIAGEEVVPELLQDEVRPENIARNILEILHNPERSERMRKGLLDVREQLGKKGASDRAAQLALNMLC